MKINAIYSSNIYFKNSKPDVKLPDSARNYTLFDQNKVYGYVARKESALPELENILKNSKDEKQIVETLYILDRMLDNGVKGVDKLYPTLSRFNETKSPNIQTFLAGIYRKTQVPDGFGPLVSMLIQNSINKSNTQKNSQTFDPNEEIGGAILEYIKVWATKPNKIDYQA